MSTITLTLSKRCPANKRGDIISFVFTPHQTLSWIAGQYIRIDMFDPDFGIEERWFTISSHPSSGVIAITTRLSPSRFKKNLFDLAIGGTVQAGGIGGDFTWPMNDVPPLFIAQGLGVTPFYSMLAERLGTDTPLSATLIYASHSDDPAFASELDEWSRKHPEFRLIYMQSADASNVVEAVKTYYVSGSSAIIAGPEKAIHTIVAGIEAQRIIPPTKLMIDWFPNASD